MSSDWCLRPILVPKSQTMGIHKATHHKSLNLIDLLLKNQQFIIVHHVTGKPFTFGGSNHVKSSKHFWKLLVLQIWPKIWMGLRLYPTPQRPHAASECQWPIRASVESTVASAPLAKHAAGAKWPSLEQASRYNVRSLLLSLGIYKCNLPIPHDHHYRYI